MMQLRIFETLDRAGQAGLRRAELAEIVYSHRTSCSPTALNVQRTLMKAALASFGLEIVSDQKWNPRWVLQAISPAPQPPLPTGTRAFPARG
jgi:hypothetical protein